MKKIYEEEMKSVDGGKATLHCTVCHRAGRMVLYKNSLAGQIAFAYHCNFDKNHERNVRRYGYGHNCCYYAKH